MVLLAIAFVMLAPSKSGAQVNPEDLFRSLEQEEPGLASRIGLAKLTAEEKLELAQLLVRAYQAGFEAAGAELKSGYKPASPSRGSSSVAFKTVVDEDNGDVLQLRNGGVVEITSGYLGYVGLSKAAVLYNVGKGWKVWIEGKRSYRCDVLRAPTAAAVSVEEVFISDVKGNGAILVMANGSVYQVDALDIITTSLWLGMSSALILNEYELINLDAGDDIITVSKIR